MKSLATTAGKLLTALNLQGRLISLEQRRFYSRKYEKMLTRYTVKETDRDSGKKTPLLAGYSLSAVVQLLAALYAEGGESG